MSWWDYGYQITAMANRTILVDNNTWNNTHISRVGQVSHMTVSSMSCDLLCRQCHLQKTELMRLCENLM